jgi:hypothetical protein
MKKNWNKEKDKFNKKLNSIFFCDLLFKLFSNMLKCVNLIEIRFYAYLYASCFFVLWQIIFETPAHMPEVEFEGKYGYLPSITNTDF